MIVYGVTFRLHGQTHVVLDGPRPLMVAAPTEKAARDIAAAADPRWWHDYGREMIFTAVRESASRTEGVI